jgi:hypothetical protein
LQYILLLFIDSRSLESSIASKVPISASILRRGRFFACQATASDALGPGAKPKGARGCVMSQSLLELLQGLQRFTKLT